MSATSEGIPQRLTLGLLSDQYGFDLKPSFAQDVTITSLANDVESVGPGSLFIPCQRVDQGSISRAVQQGAYAMLLPTSMRNVMNDPQIPILYADPTPQELGAIAAHIAGTPSETVAVFALAGDDENQLREDVDVLAQFLHMLGNPVGTLCKGDSQSLERFLDLSYPLDMFAVQRVLAVCVEDGVAAVIIALNEATLAANSLASVGIDVIGYDGHISDTAIEETVAHASQRYACTIDENTHIAIRTDETDVMAIQAEISSDQTRSLSLAISMVLAAGMRKSSIRSALRVSKELH